MRFSQGIPTGICTYYMDIYTYIYVYIYIYIYMLKAALRDRWNEENGNEVGRDGDVMWDGAGKGWLRGMGAEGGLEGEGQSG